jgi:hypothetical protein
MISPAVLLHRRAVKSLGTGAKRSTNVFASQVEKPSRLIDEEARATRRILWTQERPPGAHTGRYGRDPTYQERSLVS